MVEFVGHVYGLKQKQTMMESGATFCYYIAIWRLLPCAETTVEALHAKVVKMKALNYLGPTRVSLSNRLIFLFAVSVSVHM